jgi:ABC-type glycerol-3-phosphate transport system substrate-binding protein
MYVTTAKEVSMVKHKASAALIASLALTAAACGGGEGSSSDNGTATLQLWAYEGYQDFLPILIDKFASTSSRRPIQISPWS